MTFKPVSFNWSTTSPSIGFVAQPVQAEFMSAFTFNRKQNDPVLTITGDGDVIWNGKPSEAADILVRSFQMKVEDAKGITKAAKRRYYMLACQNLLKKAESMSHNEFIDFLNREVYNRERKAILDGLKGEE